jgi:hypothetical protein
MTAKALLARLDGVRGNNGRWRARCPVHGSRSGTLAIREAPDGRILVHCHAGCPTEEVLRTVALDWSALHPERAIDHRVPRVRKPWRVGDVVQGLSFELDIAWLILADVAAGKEIGAVDRERAGIARDRALRFLQELEHAA